MVASRLRIGSALLVVAAIPAVSGCAHRKADSDRAAVAPAHRGQRYTYMTTARTPAVQWKARSMKSERRLAAKSDDTPRDDASKPKYERSSSAQVNESSHATASQPRTYGGRPAQLASSDSRPNVAPSVVDVAVTESLPAYAQPGECYAPVFTPPQFDTVTERVLVREASEKIEIVPAEYEWVEERILVKEASTKLVEVPAQFDVEEQVFETSPAQASWATASEVPCPQQADGPNAQSIFCLVNDKPQTRTIKTQRLMKGPSVKRVAVPAEYETVRKQKLVRPASTRRVWVPAEYEDVEKTVMTEPGRMEWRLVDCNDVSLDNGKKVRPVSDTNP